MRKRSVGLTGIVLTVWLSEIIFLSISISFGIISGNFDIFEQKNDYGLNICYSLAWMSEVHSGGSKWFEQVHQP